MAKEITQEQIQMIDEMVERAKKAAAVIAAYDQARVDRLCRAVAAATYDLKAWAPLCDEAVAETGLGDPVSKRNKRNKIKLILRDCLRSPSDGVIEEMGTPSEVIENPKSERTKTFLSRFSGND